MREDLESDPPTVPLTFDLELKKLMSGHPVVIETAARDEFGKVQEFASAGSLSVGPAAPLSARFDSTVLRRPWRSK